MYEIVQQAAALNVVLLLFALVAKVDAWSRWVSTSQAFVPESPSLGRTLALTIPIAEATCACFTLLDPFAGLVTSAGLYAVFAIGVLVVGRAARDTECGCFGAIMPSRIGGSLAVRNLALAATAGAASFGALRLNPAIVRPQPLVTASLVGLLTVLGAEYFAGIGVRTRVGVRGRQDAG
jgi:hypothetical protein